MSIKNNAIRAKAEAFMNCNLTLNFSDGSKKLKKIQEGDFLRDLSYKEDGKIFTIDGKVLVINFSSVTSESEGIVDSNLAKSKSVFSNVVKPISLVVDTSEVYKSDVVNVPINKIINIKADTIINEKYQGNVFVVDENTNFATAIGSAQDGDTILLASGTINEDIDISKAVRITAKKDDDNNYEEAIISGNVVITADSGTVEIDHVTFKDITSAEGTGPNKSTAKGNGINVTGSADINIHEVEFTNFNNFYNMIAFNGEGTVLLENNTFAEVGKNYHVIEFATDLPVSKVIIRDNKFGNVCTQNVISMYAYAENADITIDNNEFAYSGNALRFSNSNNGKALIKVFGNIYKSTDKTETDDPRCSSTTYAGLSIFQDYTGNQDFTKIDIIFTGNYYAPADGAKVLLTEDTQNTEAQAYYVYVDREDYAITLPNALFMN